MLRALTAVFILAAVGCAPITGYMHYSMHERNGAEDKGERMEEGKKAERRILESSTIDMSRLDTLGAVIEKTLDKRIIYVGEYHDQAGHHDVQLEVIKAAYAMDPRLAVGMEMFQRPFQNALDDYISGAISERVFLKRSEYFKRWGFEYGLYKPIIDFCREKRIPLVALNARREITEKVSRKGLDALSEEERKEIPGVMDLKDEEYRTRLKEVFEKHTNPEDKNFDFFYQAQIVWDETMALSIDEFMKKNPDHRMVVLAGGGHLAYGSGIPKRAFRRNGLPYAVILNDGDVEKGIADFIVFPGSREIEAAPRLMANLEEGEGGVLITGFGQDSPAKKGGLRKGDRIISIDGEKVSDIQDVKIALLYKKKGDDIKVAIVRERFLFWEEEMEIQFRL